MTEAPRVASLVPSATEWMYALGLQDRLVAVTFECDVPTQAKREKPWLVRSTLEGYHATAREVDARVRELITRGEPLYRLDEKVLLDTQPDVLLSQSLCDVCSASQPQVDEAARLLGRRPRVASLHPHTLAQALEDARVVAEAAGAPDAAEKLLSDLRVRLFRLKLALKPRPRPRVAVLEWTDPPMACGHWFPDIVAAGGGEEVLGEPGGKSAVVDGSALEEARPDVIFVMPCGFDTERSVEEARKVRERAGAARVVAFDANRYFSRSGPSLVRAAELVAHVLHPEVVPDPDPTAWREVQSSRAS